MNRDRLLAKCIDEILSGQRTLESCIKRHPELDDELRLLLRMSMEINNENVQPSPEFVQKARANLIAVMGDENRKRRPSWFHFTRKLGLPSIMATVVGVVVTSGGVTVFASQSSLPGDALYPVKLSVENFQLAITPFPESKASLHIEFAQKRVDEAVAQLKLNRQIDSNTVNEVADQLDRAMDDIGAIPPDKPDRAKTVVSQLLRSGLEAQMDLNGVVASGQAISPVAQQIIDVTRRGNTIAQVAYANPALLKSKPSVKDASIDRGAFTVNGPLLHTDPNTWNVGGAIITNVKPPPNVPPVGTMVTVSGISIRNENYISEVQDDHSDQPQSTPVSIAGTFNGASADGKTWYVASIPVSPVQTTSIPSKGDSVVVHGAVSDNKLDITTVNKKDEGPQNVNLQGTILRVNTRGNTITAEASGTQMTVNLSQATLQTQDGKPLKLSDLTDQIGQMIQLNDLYNEGKVTMARQISVQVRSSASTKPDSRSPAQTPASTTTSTYATTPTPTQTSTPTSSPTPTRSSRNGD